MLAFVLSGQAFKAIIFSMSLNNIKLQDILLAELYKDTLISISSSDGASTIYPRPAAPAQPSPPPPAAVITSPPVIPSPAKAPAPPATGYKFLGNNRRKITILVQSPNTAFLPDDQLTFLTKILEACQMNIGDVAIVNHAHTPVVITELRQQLQSSIILLFGVDPIAIRLPIRFPVFKTQAYDSCTYLSAPALEELVPATHEGKLLKSKLWVCLKTLFNV